MLVKSCPPHLLTQSTDTSGQPPFLIASRPLGGVHDSTVRRILLITCPAAGAAGEHAERAEPCDTAPIPRRHALPRREKRALRSLGADDARVSGRKAVEVIRSGKGDVYREVPLNAPARKALDEWLKKRPAPAVRIGGEPLFVSRAGGRLSARSVDDVVRKLGRVAGVELSAHVLRHTWVTRLVRAGNDVVLVADLAGHRKLETTRRYSLPSLGDRQRAVEGLAVDQ